MSRPNRRRQRPGSPTPASSPTGSPPPTPTTGGTADVAGMAEVPGMAADGADLTADAADLTADDADLTAVTAATPAAAATVTASGTTAPRPTGTSGTSGRSPSGTSRAGRRERQRTATQQPTFLGRHRTLVVVVAALAGVALVSAFVFLSASNAAFACSTEWTPAPTASPAAGATPALGYVQPDMGRGHTSLGDKVTYTYCAPASGQHYNKPGTAGPITPRVYGPNDTVLPQGWLHNLEHGGLVVLYTGSSSGASAEGQAQLRAFYDKFPPGPVCGTPKGTSGPVIARFDQMTSPFQAIVWGRVLLLDTFDQAKILAFWDQWGERTNPEAQCAKPTPIPSVAPSAAPSPS